MKKIIFSLLIVCVVFVGCYYDKSDMVNPNLALLGCDTTNVTYSSTIASILSNSNCLNCHGGSASSGDKLNLDNYATVKASALKGELLPAVRQDVSCAVCAANYKPMPTSGSKLSDCEVNKIAAWIHQGCKN